ncbi:MAG: hypothetical protein GX660_07645 [Clostridiaceae bacterium]|nr:hypothetical protein [Clostridiaceae bacterium]
MHYLVIAYDGNDEKALDRRKAAREEHHDGVIRRSKTGEHLFGGGILDGSGNMVGSYLIVNYASREDLDQWLKEEPFVVQGVWQKIEIKPITVASTWMELYKL